MAVDKVFWTKGDTLSTLGAQLKVASSTNTYSNYNLTGKTVKAKIVNAAGTVIKTESTSGVTVISATDGKVALDFSSSHVGTIGTHFLWFKAYSSSQCDTFPANGRKFQIEIVGSS